MAGESLEKDVKLRGYSNYLLRKEISGEAKAQSETNVSTIKMEMENRTILNC